MDRVRLPSLRPQGARLSGFAQPCRRGAAATPLAAVAAGHPLTSVRGCMRLEGRFSSLAVDWALKGCAEASSRSFGAEKQPKVALEGTRSLERLSPACFPASLAAWDCNLGLGHLSWRYSRPASWTRGAPNRPYPSVFGSRLRALGMLSQSCPPERPQDAIAGFEG